MKLKKVEIQGFKSFADKTEIEIKEGITAIVGPNGSGKSNISDAIRWVLGEQSVKNLRGSKMEDVIFAGTTKRKPLGFSEVTITFDNKEKLIPMDYSEIAVTRRMFRSGESEYYINKNSCRLRDIRELFMDTGVGKDGYSIIGQGRIDEILSNRPEDRRSIFEEAAGIVKYKSKKEEAERKLEKTEGNIIRIKDLIFELTNQLEVLEIQANKANSFTELYNRLKDLEINLFIRDIRKINAQIKEIEEDKLALEVKLEDRYGEKEKLENKFNLLKINIDEMEKNIENCRNKNLETMNELDKNKNELSIVLEQEKYINKDLRRLEEEKDILELKLKNLRDVNIELKEEIESLEKEHNLLLSEYDEKNFEVEKDLQILHEKEEAIENKKNNMIRIYNSLSEKKSELNSILSFNENIEKRIFQLDKERNSLASEKNNSLINIEKLEKKENQTNNEIDFLKASIEKIKEDELDNRNILESTNKEINNNSMELQSKISSLKLLENMEADYEGYYKGVKSLLKAAKKDNSLGEGLLGVIAELIKVDAKLEKAIDISLGSNIQNIVTDNEEYAKKMINYLKRNNLGRITCLPLNVIKGNAIKLNEEDKNEFKILGLGFELIDYDKKYENIFKYLLGRTIIIENMDYGIKFANKYNHSHRIVTLDGEILNPGGSMTGGSFANNATSIIGRKNKIENLKEDIKILNKNQEKLKDIGNTIAKKLANLNKELGELEDSLNDKHYEIINIKNEKDKLNNDMYRLDKEIERSTKEIDNLNNELGNYLLRKEKLGEDISNLEKENQEKRNNIVVLTNDLNQEKSLRENKIKTITDMKININSIISKINNDKDRLENSIAEINSTIINVQDKDSLIENNKNNLEELNNRKSSLNELINDLSMIAQDTQSELKDLIQSKEEVMKNFYQEQDRLIDINKEVSLIEKQQNSQEVKLAKISVQLENYHKKLMEDYELSFEDALSQENELEDIQRAIIETRRLKVQIKELGSVNLSSIEEYKALKERLDFILGQQKDLTTAKENLKDVIKDMEEKMTKQFLENFKEINEGFQDVFKVLFNGGQAKLVIEDKENVLSSGIEIQAQPPGKNLQNLSLLSGGEKSLTAVALLFAILKTKPSPFCILDEIDAALDEANIGRYTNYLKTFCDDTQFVLITHRKTTMEIADILYGVAMEEEGVSSLISVKLKDFIDEIAS